MSKEEKEKRKQERNIKKYNETHKLIDDVIYKWCYQDEHWVEMNEENFYKTKNLIDGFHTYCKKCVRKRTLKWIEDNPEKRKELMDNYWENLKGDRRKRYNLKIKLMMERYRQEGGYKEWQQNNPDKIKQYRLDREQNKTHKISKKEWESCLEYFNNSCAYCGLPIEEHLVTRNGITKQGNFHKEHVSHTGANDLSNCVPSCKYCNSEKHTFTLEEWYNKNNIKFSKKRLNKIHRWLNEDYKLYIKDDKL